jgi:uncharacterized membrane protein YqaE (UPF0057 family)
MLPVLAVVCPPVAVLAVRPPAHAALNALLTLCFYLPGAAHALAAVAAYRTERRNAALLEAVALTA